MESDHAVASRGRRRARRRLPSLEAIRGTVGTRTPKSEAGVSVLPPQSPPTVNPLMEMFGFGETTDPPWEFFEEPAPRPAPEKILSPIGPMPDAPAKNRPGSQVKNRPSIFDALPRLSDLASSTPSEDENTGTLIKRLWEATDDFEPMDSWMPKAEYIDRLGQKPLLRWIAGGVVGLAVMLVIVSAIVSGGSTDAPPPAEQAVTATGAATSSADSVHDAVAIVSDPTSSGVQINEAAVVLSEFDTASRELASAANALTEREGAAVSSALLISASEQGTAIERRLGAALTYRLVFEKAFLLPEMPESADITAAAETSFELSAMVADTERVLDQLPFDPALEDHRRLAAQALADIEVLSGRYVEALRAERAGAAARHRATIEELAQETHAALATTLPILGEEIDDQVIAFESTLDEAAAALFRLELSQ